MSRRRSRPSSFSVVAKGLGACQSFQGSSWYGESCGWITWASSEGWVIGSSRTMPPWGMTRMNSSMLEPNPVAAVWSSVLPKATSRTPSPVASPRGWPVSGLIRSSGSLFHRLMRTLLDGSLPEATKSAGQEKANSRQSRSAV